MVSVAIDKNYSKCMGYCSTFNADNSAIIHQILTEKMFLKGSKWKLGQINLISRSMDRPCFCGKQKKNKKQPKNFYVHVKKVN